MRSVSTDSNELWLPVAQEGSDKGPSDLVDQLPIFDTPTDTQAHIPTFEAVEPKWRSRIELRLSLALEGRRDQMSRALEFEQAAGAGFLWAPVLFGIGCIVYFNLPREPLVWAFPAVAVITGFLAWRIGAEYRTFTVLLGIAHFAAGVSGAQLRTLWVGTEMMPKTVIAEVTGTVLQAERRANGRTRYTLDLSGVGSGLKGARLNQIPKNVRLTARKGGAEIAVGDLISGKARLGPLPGPAYPGAYDFSFRAWYLGIGGSGFFLGSPTKVQVSSAKDRTGFSPGLLIAKTRAAVADIIRTALPGQSGGLAIALIVGDRSGIDDETAEALRRSGLAHILAISGLHMALVAATMIFGIRMILALFPTVVLHYPVRKWASLAALGAATVYLLLSGGNVSTQRAYIMVAIVLVAVLFDRRALTMRNVAIAAFAVLLLAPEAIMTPGFQMSFAAVAALVGTYEVLTKRARAHRKENSAGPVGAIRRFVVRDLGGLALTSLVAGIATGLFAAYHFNRVAPFGLVANLLAMPLVSIMVMPLALISALLMPFGLETLPLNLMAYGTGWVVKVASWVSNLGPLGNTGQLPVSALLTGSLALLTATLCRTWLKTLSIPLVGLAALFIGTNQPPDLLVLENGRQIGVLKARAVENSVELVPAVEAERAKSFALMRPNAEKFSTAIWRRAFTPDVEFLLPKKVKGKRRSKFGDQYRCDDFGCSTQLEEFTIVHLRSTAQLIEDCSIADIIVVPFELQNACIFLPANQRPLIIDTKVLRRFGGHSIRLLPKVELAKVQSVEKRKFVQPDNKQITNQDWPSKASEFELDPSDTPDLTGDFSSSQAKAPELGPPDANTNKAETNPKLKRLSVTRSYNEAVRPWTAHRFTD